MAKKITVELDVKTKEGVKEVDKLNKKLSNTKTESKEAGKSLDGVSGGAIGKFNALKGSIGGVVKGFKSLKFAIIASGIGALLIAVLAVGKAFTNSEEGQNKFAKIMAVIGSVTGNLVDLLAGLGDKIISVFTSPKKALLAFKNLIVENITNRFKAILDTIGFLGSAFKKVFSGDFSGALEDAKKAGSSYVDTLTGVKNTIDKVTGAVKKMTDEITNDAKVAANIADQRAKADKLDRKLIVERAEANRKRADLLDKAAQKEKFSAQERINFLTEAGDIEDKITEKEIKAAKIRFETKVAENALSKSTKEDLIEEAELKAKLIDLETAKLTKQKTVSAQIVGARREEAARIKAIDDKAAADRKEITDKEAEAAKIKRDKEAEEAKIKEDKELKRLENLKTIRDDFEAMLQEEKAVKESEKLELEKQRRLKELEDLKATEEQKAKTIAYYNSKISEQKKAEDSADLKRSILISQQKQALALNSLSAIAGLLGQNSKFGKALAITSSIRDTYAGASKALAQGGIWGAVAAAGVIATGFANVSQISATKEPAPPSFARGGGGGGSSASTPAPSAPPAFNVVGASETSQLADSIGGQTNKPQKAYVVSGDVTTGQEMDRNIIKGASI
jgi:hypothetical protein